MNKMIPFIMFLSILPAYASIDYNLKYGMKGQEVSELQEFLISKGVLQTEPTGNFYSLTLQAVKLYQEQNGIPDTGYVGVLTRAKINEELSVVVASSTEEEIKETGTTTVQAPVVYLAQPTYQPVYQPVYQPIQSGIQPQTFGNVAPPPIPAPTCSISMEKVDTWNYFTGTTTIASTTITSTNATKLVLVQTSPIIGTYPISTSTVVGKNVPYLHTHFNLPMSLHAIFTGQGGEVTCDGGLTE